MSSTTPDATPRSTPTKPPPLSISSATPPTTPPSPASPPNTESAFSSSNRSSTASTTRSSIARNDLMARRRGFTRPQGTEFSTSARSRESVMALGSIAHLQYFFAKTGLLDGKGGGLKTKKSFSNLTVDITSSGSARDSTYSSLRSSPELLLPYEHEYFSESPSEGIDDFIFDESAMLPPTTSTYNPQTRHVPPAPDPDVLRGQLRESLAITRRAWKNSPLAPQSRRQSIEDAGPEKPLPELPSGFQEIQGTELVELATAAIRAAKAYYYSTDISLLTFKDDRILREEFLAILDVLRRMTQRKFDGGIKEDEKEALQKWAASVEEALNEEERAIADLRKKGREWLEGDWDGREHDRNRRFLSYFDTSPEPLPSHKSITSSTALPTPFLAALQNGLRLINIHNAVVRRSKRPFGQISHIHTEFSKPYRLAENLRYWKKAAEIRWETRLTFDVMAVVNGTPDGWTSFDRDIMLWCEKVLEEVQRDWQLGEGAAAVGHQVRQGRSGTMESLMVEVGDDRRA